MTTLRRRRSYTAGRCQDCGRQRAVTEIIFSVNGKRHRVCGHCIKPYRRQILKPCLPTCTGCQPRSGPHA